MPRMSAVRYAIRFLIRTPTFSVPALASLALGIAVNTMMFSLVSATLLRPLGAPGASELVRIGRSVGGDNGFRSLSYDELRFIREHATSLTSVFGEEMQTLAVGGRDGARMVAAEIVTGNYFEGLRVTPPLGRGFTVHEERPSGDARVAVISESFWRRGFGADAAIAGHPITVNNVQLTIVGVAPPGFAGTFPGLEIDLWVPLGAGDLVTHRAQPGRIPTLQLMARLKEEVPIAAARAELQVLARRMSDQDPRRPYDRGFSIAPARGVHPVFQGPARIFLLLLMTAVALVLLIACANVAGLLLARGSARRQELAIRAAVGATRARLVAQLLAESVVLAVAGGGAGVLLAVWPIGLLNDLIRVMGPDGVPVSLDLRVDERVLLFTAAASVGTAMVFGILPALRTTRGDLSPAASHRSSAGRLPGRPWLRGSLTVAQVALSAVLLVAAGLIFRSLRQTAGIDLGFTPDAVVVASFADLRQFGYDGARVGRFHEEWLARVRAQPGVERAAFADFVPLSEGMGHPQRFNIPGRAPGEDLTLSVGRVSDGYFATLGQPLRGRDFTAQDRPGAPAVAIVNEAAARRFWPGDETIGKRIQLGDVRSEHTIVGVVRDGRYTSFGGDVPPLVFLPGLADRGTLHVRVAVPPDQALTMVRQLAHAIEPSLPPFAGGSLRDAMASSLVPGQIVQLVLGIAGGIALLLSSAGLYSVVRYTVERRRREIGIRIALGATGWDVFRLITAGAARLTTFGLAVGLLVAAAATRVMAALLYGLDSVDPLTFAAVAALLLFVALAAGYTAIRAGLSHDPVALLRSE
jgi:predicted permease